ncbi:uncharacterized protein LOC127797327 isoform X2 [Diospyros lotus]|uniref:uncharacterized protein LOC127797327 isoform X2 n=1 Tax=Diospyros lotus TaxID=55363 RepID=UPI002252283D|nr:uncharacterized protein LOC127797327 isoform X2 [Diospyros lotus]
MSNAAVYTSLAATFVLLTICFLAIQTDNHSDSKPRRPGRRLGYKIPPPIFDPLFVKIEKLSKEKGLDNQKNRLSDELDQEDVDEYLRQGGEINVTLRLIHLFPLVDVAPKDGYVDSNELQAWITQQANDRLTYRTQRELESHDRDGDGAISLREYLHNVPDEDLERNEMGHGEPGWWREQFRNADTDKNGILDFYEFKKPIDQDNDEKLNFEEFKNGAYDTYKNYVELEHGEETVPNPEDMFAKLDLNNDKFLKIEELKPILRYLSPGELSYAKFYMSYLIHQADENGDGKLTLDEMIKHEYIFYNTVYEDGVDNYGDDDYYDHHEEL